jgi:hypothetical protein
VRREGGREGGREGEREREREEVKQFEDVNNSKMLK